MKKKSLNLKDKNGVVEFAKEAIEVLKANRLITAVAAFSLICFILILVAIFVLQEFVVSVCVLIIIEAAMAALLHQAEIWKHGILVGLQFVAAVIIARIPLVILCILAYVAATFALQFMGNKNE